MWSPDGESIVFSRLEEGVGRLYIKRADGTDERRLLTKGFFPTISPDGKWLLFNRTEQGGFHILRLDLEDPEAEPMIILENAMRPRFSPDGSFVAYTSVGDGQPLQVSLTRFPEITGRWQISAEGGGFVHWRADGRELFYLNDRGRHHGDVPRVEAHGQGWHSNPPVSPPTDRNPHALRTAGQVRRIR